MTPLRPAVAAYLDAATRSTTEPSGPSVPELRQHWNEFVMQTHLHVRPPLAEVEVFDETTASGVAIRRYVPTTSAPEGGDVHVHLHGGGWWMGSVETVDPMSRSLAAGLGMPVISVAYPLAPEHPFPAALDAVADVLHWANERFASISLGGESAGANLAAACAIRGRDTGGPVLAGLWLDVPVVDLRLPQDESLVAYGSGLGIEVAMVAQISEWYAGAERLDNPLISPAVADLAGLPPTLVSVAELDPFRDQGLRFADQLREAGVAVDTRVAEGHIHGSAWLTGLDDYTSAWQDDAIATLARCHQKELTA